MQTWLDLRRFSVRDLQLNDQSAFVMLYHLFQPFLSTDVLELPESQFKTGCNGCGLDVLAEQHGKVWFNKTAMCPSHEWRTWVYVHLTCAGMASKHTHVLERKLLALKGLLEVLTESRMCQAAIATRLDEADYQLMS